jgi:hypothetical protein
LHEDQQTTKSENDAVTVDSTESMDSLANATTGITYHDLVLLSAYVWHRRCFPEIRDYQGFLWQ